MLASIIIPTYNHPELTCATLAGLRQQTCRNFEVVIVDDGSTPPFADAISPTDYPFPLLIKTHAKNRGRAAARNTGILAARHPLLIFLDGDMTVSPDFVQAHIRSRQYTAPAIDTVVIGNIRFIDALKNKPLARYLDTRGVHKLKLFDNIPYRYFVTGNSALPRLLLEKAGLFDESFPRYGGEDLELACRLHHAGARFAYCGEAMAFHHQLPDLAVHCRRMNEYGRYCLPVLLQKHPQAAGFLHMEWVDTSFCRLDDRLKQALGRFFFQPPFFHIAQSLVESYGSDYLQSILLDFLTGGNYLLGYRQYLKAEGKALA